MAIRATGSVAARSSDAKQVVQVTVLVPDARTQARVEAALAEAVQLAFAY